MIEKLRIFFIKAWEGTNPRLYRSTVVCERFEHLFGVQLPVTHELPGEQQHGYFVAVADAGVRIFVHVEHVEGVAPRGRKPLELGAHLLA
jgi:hypothetical protein